jgi:membrane dipeptidase
VQVFAVFCNETFGKGTAFSYANREIDSLDAIVSRNPNDMMLVNSPATLKKAVRQKKLGAMMGVEGGHMIEGDINKLDSFYKRGVRYMTLTWNNSTSWASSARDETLHPDSQHNGLSQFGMQVVARMNQLGMLVDLSHVGEQTFYAALNVTTRPVLVSHSCVYTLCHHFRNLKDDQIRAIGKNGGVIDINFYSGFVDSNYMSKMDNMRKAHQLQVDSLTLLKLPEYSIGEWLTATYPQEAESLRPTIQQLVDHIDYVVKLIGIDHVGIGSDFDGIESPPQQLDDVTGYPLVTRELVKRGYSKRAIRKILGGNFIRVFKANRPSG